MLVTWLRSPPTYHVPSRDEDCAPLAEPLESNSVASKSSKLSVFIQWPPVASMNKRDPIYQNHGELVVGVDHLLLSLTFRQPNYGLAAVETETQNNAKSDRNRPR